MSKLWLGILYILVIGPSAIIAKITERQPTGFIPPESWDEDILERARQQA